MKKLFVDIYFTSVLQFMYSVVLVCIVRIDLTGSFLSIFLYSLLNKNNQSLGKTT